MLESASQWGKIMQKKMGGGAYLVPGDALSPRGVYLVPVPGGSAQRGGLVLGGSGARWEGGLVPGGGVHPSMH